uniref:K Homology domain-containing protein n=1 Tax=Ananas comosus var. bracteatus TaxID=296719 RepID=A0A6V7P371_ANACO|nr:unnamed protein product [Ananas comosus var. bracteatus]
MMGDSGKRYRQQRGNDNEGEIRRRDLLTKKDKEPMDADEDGKEPICPAQDALLKVHDAIVTSLANASDSDKKSKEEANILVPASQAANIIGKSGATIKRLRSNTKANIRVNPKDPNEATHSCAMSFDNFVQQITGDSKAVNKALYAISAIMYKFSPKEEISLETSVSEIPPSIIIPSDVPVYSAGGFYPSVDSFVPPRSGLSTIGTTPHPPDLSGLTNAASSWPIYPSALPVVSGFSSSSRSEELILRVLCPSDKIGRVIGKGGSTIKSIRQESGSRIDVDDTKGETEECVITVSSTESTYDVKSSAVEAVLLLQGKINDEDDDTVNIRLLVPSKVIGCLIGKGGSIVNDMRKKTKADIRISKGEKPKQASSSDELVEVVSGEVGHVRDALVQIVLKLREDALRDKEGSQNVTKDSNPAIPPLDPLYTSALPTILSSMPPVAPLSYESRVEAERELTVFPGGSLYGYNSLQAGENSYGSLSSYSSKLYGGLPPYTEMVIPSHALSKVMGKGGTNLENIRKISGAHIEIVDSKTSHFERIAQISGTPEQKQSAENLIKAFVMST